MKLKTIVIVALLVLLSVSAGFILTERARNRQQASEVQVHEALAPPPEASEPGTADDVNPSFSSSGETPGSLEQPPEKTQSSGTTAGEPQSLAPPQPAREESEQERPSSSSAQRVLVYYFHGTQRCATCRKLEAFSLEAVQQGFQDALQQGQLEWHMVNVDEVENTHFVNDYQLYTRSLVIAKMVDGKQTEWKNLKKIWELVGDKTAFMSYVQNEIRTYIGDES